MKPIRFYTVGAALALLGAPVTPSGAANPPAWKGQPAVAKATLRIEGMHCQGCAAGVKKVLERVKGVRSARVDAAKKVGTVEYDPKACRPAALVAAVKKGGFQAQLKQ